MKASGIGLGAEVLGFKGSGLRAESGWLEVED